MSKVAQFLRRLALTPADIAGRSKLPAERVQGILNGREATLGDLQALARGLRLPIREFVRTDDAPNDFALLFRSTISARPDSGVEKAADFVEAALSILPPRGTPPDWITKLAPTEESYSEASHLAESFRSLFLPERPDDPLPDLADILVHLGGLIIGRLSTSRFEGASVIADGYAFAFVSPRFSGRMLFTLAHELGHLLAHHGEGRAPVFDLSTQIGNSRAKSRAEAFVNAFASALLMPARGVGVALQQIRAAIKANADQIGDVEILYLARFYGVSFDVAARRCEDLELLPKGGAFSLGEHLRKNHGGAERRAKALGIPDRPTVHIPAASSNLLAAAASKIESGDISVGWVADRFGCTVADIYSARSTIEANRGPHH